MAKRTATRGRRPPTSPANREQAISTEPHFLDPIEHARLIGAEIGELQPNPVPEMSKAEEAAMWENLVDYIRVASTVKPNPMYAWQALMYRIWAVEAVTGDSEQRGPVTIPGWCVDYFLTASQNLVDLAGGADLPITDVRLLNLNFVNPTQYDPKGAMKRVTHALQFVDDDGYNAFKARRTDERGIEASLRLDALRLRGKGGDDALAGVQSAMNPSQELEPSHDVTWIRKLASRGREIIKARAAADEEIKKRQK